MSATLPSPTWLDSLSDAERELVSMGFPIADVRAALKTSDGNREAAIECMLAASDSQPPATIVNSQASTLVPKGAQGTLLDPTVDEDEDEAAKETLAAAKRAGKLHVDVGEAKQEQDEDGDEDEDESGFEYEDESDSGAFLYSDGDESDSLQGVWSADASPATPQGVHTLDSSSIIETQRAEMNKMGGVLAITPDQAGVLLRHFQWNTEKLLERCLDDRDKVFADAGLSNLVAGTADGGAAGGGAAAAAGEDAMCMVCCDDESPLTLPCGHTGCVDCWKQYLEMKIMEGESSHLTCMGFSDSSKCNLIVDEAIVKRVCSAEIHAKYADFVARSYVDENKMVTWCPSAGCSNAVRMTSLTRTDVACACGHHFCFKCNHEAHAPATCQLLVVWEKKCKDDTETSNWIKVNTRVCPSCSTPIEKNGGCNHMTCRKCKHEFCWLCSGDWRGHTSCNRYEDEGKQDETKSALERYLHYFHRYDTHDKSQRFETRLRADASAKMVELYQDGVHGEGARFVEDATEQLIACRRALKYTYVFAFYMASGPEKELFEYLQQELEVNTENLARALETLDYSLAQDRLQIVNLSKMARQRLKNLHRGVEEGLTSSAGPVAAPPPSSSAAAAADASASSSTAATTSTGRRSLIPKAR